MESKTRRKLLKSVASAPIVMTVAPGAALATSSAFMCKAKDAAKASPKETLAPSKIDEWLRVQLDIVELHQYDSQARTWKKLPGQYFLGTDGATYWCLSDVSPDTLPARPTQYKVGNVSKQKVGTKFAMSYVGPNGTQVGYAWEKNAGSKMSASCWNSVTIKA